MNNILVVAPHPDDDILGCGGMISRNGGNGANIYVAIMTNGNIGAPELFPIEGTLRGRQEALNSHKLLGVKETFFFDFPAPRLDAEPSYKISIAISNLIQKLKINEMYIPHRGDIHKDHRIIYESSLVAARPISDHKVSKIYAYETLSETASEILRPISASSTFATSEVVLAISIKTSESCDALALEWILP